MKNILRHLWRSKTDLLAFIAALTATIYYMVIGESQFGGVMLLVSLYVFRGIMWMGQTIDKNTELNDKIKTMNKLAELKEKAKSSIGAIDSDGTKDLYVFTESDLNELLTEVAREQREKDLKYLSIDIFQVYSAGKEAEECERIRNTPLITETNESLDKS